VERVRTGRVGIIGKITGSGRGAYGLYQRVFVDVLQASMDAMPSRIKIDFDPCLIWTAREGDVVNLNVWQRVGPHSGAYTLAPCTN